MAEADNEQLSLEEAIGADIDAALAGADKGVEAESSQPRDESGRFAKKPAETEAAPIEPKALETEAPPASEAAPAKPQQTWRPLWHKNEMGEWEQLPEPLRKAIEQREREAAQGIEKHSTAAKAWEPVTELLKPHMQELQASGVSPQQYVANLVNADKYLRQEPVAALNWLAQAYCQTDLQGIVDWMAQNNYQPQRVDPVQQEIQALKAQIEQLKTAPQEQRRAELQQELQAWSKDKPYFEELRSYMAALARTPDYHGATYDQLYEAAQYAHPGLRERILTDQRKREVTEARARGAQSPRGTPEEGAQPRKPAKRRSVEEDVKAAFDEAGF